MGRIGIGVGLGIGTNQLSVIQDLPDMVNNHLEPVTDGYLGFMLNESFIGIII